MRSTSYPVKVVQHPAAKAYEQRLGQAALAGSMTPSERLHSGLTEQGEPRARRAKEPPKPKVTGEALLEGAVALNNSLRPRT